MKYIRKIFEESKPLSNAWKTNCIKFLKRGDTVDSGELSKMGKRDVILKHFPMADPNFSNFKPSDVGRYLQNNPGLMESVKNNTNILLSKKTPKTVVSNRHSKKVNVAGFDAGYLNIDYKAILTKAKLLSFGEKNVKGEANFKISCSIPDGVFDGASLSINVNAKFVANYTISLNDKEAVINIVPKSIVLNSPSYKIGARVRIQIVNNKVKIHWGTYMNNPLGSSVIYTIKPLSELKKVAGSDISFVIPRESLRISTVPLNADQIKKVIG
jgi:hypothetical protein